MRLKEDRGTAATNCGCPGSYDFKVSSPTTIHQDAGLSKALSGTCQRFVHSDKEAHHVL